MEQNNFQRLLLETAICTMACDGEIHEKEINELESIVKMANYFKDFSGHTNIKEMVDSIRADGRKVLLGYLEELARSELSPVQEMLVLEVMLRIIYADNRFDENEFLFMKLVRSKLHLHDEMIVNRFGSVPGLTRLPNESFSDLNLREALNIVQDKFVNIKQSEYRESFSLKLYKTDANINNRETDPNS